jgi:hypothetical protein
MHDFRKLGVLRDIGYFDSASPQEFSSTSGAQDMNAGPLQSQAKLGQACFVAHADQRSTNRQRITHWPSLNK